FLCRLLHLKIILLKKPLRTALCNKANLNNYLVGYFKDTTKCFRVSTKLKGSLKPLQRTFIFHVPIFNCRNNLYELKVGYCTKLRVSYRINHNRYSCSSFSIVSLINVE
ncbi:hypothetical protein EJ486_16955, partial [Acinetobacter baumannii]